MRDAQPTAIYLKDYTPPAFFIETTDLSFQLHDDYTDVTTQLRLVSNADNISKDLQLHGENLELLSLAIDGQALATSDYAVDDKLLTLFNVPANFELTSVVRIKPHENKALEGLYRSRTMYCTQCEAEGFRKITYYLDRPDVLSRFTTRIEAAADAFPILLSNGNCIESGALTDGRHFSLWQDPHPKPSYLFALVAGDLSPVSDTFTTMSGREVAIELYVEPKDLDKCDHAVDSLKRAMAWDEQVYGREYDLDIYMIVAVDDFNMGAMENKGLNVFNTSCVLAHPKTTTDMGFQRVEAVVAHEYFHNWSGNRVTCRDWFQLSLKEGFTVYRDAEFSADMGSRTVKRVEDVALLRTAQFAEDNGPMAHPIQPASFIEISNFYTVTIYEKGAEVVRMIAQLLGPQLFREACDLYFDRHDGQAVTCDDFVQAMADASGRDFSQFKRWYSQAGTPRIEAAGEYDAVAKAFSLTLSQSCPVTPNQPIKEPFFIPVKTALVGSEGLLPLTLNGTDLGEETVLELSQPQQTFVFENMSEAPTPSLLREFSAPVKLSYNYSPKQLVQLVQQDTDGFNRWDAAQRLASQELLAIAAGKGSAISPALITVFENLLQDTSLDPAMVAFIIRLPSENYLAEISEELDPEAIHKAREGARLVIAEQLQDLLLSRYKALEIEADYQANSEQIAIRSLRNSCLAYLSLLDESAIADVAVQQYRSATNMTDQFAALTAIVHSSTAVMNAVKADVLADFYDQWKNEALVVNQWLQVQAAAAGEGALAKVQALMQHSSFDINNPNKVRAVVGAFAGINVAFHQRDGAGYTLLADIIIQLNTSNPQIASRLLTPLTRWKKLAQPYQTAMKAQLARIAEQPDLSKDVFEVVSKSLA